MAIGGGYHHQQQPYAQAPGIPIGPVPSAPFQGQNQGPGQWTTGLCDCCDDISNCCITCWCPCITFGQIAEIVDRGSTSCGASGAIYGLVCALTGCSWIYSCFYRSKMRSQYSLPDTPCTDCLVHCCCEGCALCQEYRELRNRGFDMYIGWQGNMEKRATGALNVPPPMQVGMNR